LAVAELPATCWRCSTIHWCNASSNGPTVLLAHLQPLWCRQGLNLPFDLIDPGELRQGQFGDLALARRVQLEELAPGVCQAPASVTPWLKLAL